MFLVLVHSFLPSDEENSGFTPYICPLGRCLRKQGGRGVKVIFTMSKYEQIVLQTGIPKRRHSDILKVDFFARSNFNFEILRKKKLKNMTKNYLICVKSLDTTTLNEV